MTTAHVQHPPFGSLMKQWRQRRRISQLDLAIEADVSSRHVSFIETGRSAPSRAMVLRLADALDVPLREQNQLLMAAGLAPVYAERSLHDSGHGGGARRRRARCSKAYEPFPCLAVDRGWNIVAANAGAGLLLDGVAPHLLDPPNALRISLHPDGLGAAHSQSRAVAAPRDRSAAQGGDGQRFGGVGDAARRDRVLPRRFRSTTTDLGGVVVPLEFDGPDGAALTFLSTVTTFGTALDLTAAELSIEAFLPADEATAAALR